MDALPGTDVLLSGIGSDDSICTFPMEGILQI